VAVLVLLARFRFPASELTAMAPAPGPLAGLAARATFDEMTSSLTDCWRGLRRPSRLSRSRNPLSR
jgi:hypothetical protein